MIQDVPPALPEIVVTAARLPPAGRDAAFSVLRLDRDALQRPLRLDEALTAVPGVALFRRTSSHSANPTTQGLSLRAIAPSGAGRALVTLDGVPLNDPFGGWVIWSQLPPEMLDGADIIRGAGSGPWGAGALTGAVALREREAESGVLALSGSEDGGARAVAAFGLDLGPARLLIGVGGDRTDGYVPVRGPDAGPADTPLAFDSQQASARLDLAGPAGAAVSLRGSIWDERRQSGLAGARSSTDGDAWSLTVARAPRADRPGWRLQAWRRTSDLSNTSVAVAAGRTATTPANDQYATPAVGTGVNLAVRGGRADGTEWEIGVDARRFEGETRERFRSVGGAFTRNRIAGGRTSVAGVYAEGSWSSGPWLLAGGLRGDVWSSTDGHRTEADIATGAVLLDEVDPDRSGRVASARVGVRRRLDDGWSVRAAATSGFRPATLNELHRPFRVGNDVTEANAALAPERLSGVELGLDWSGARSEVTLTAFSTRLDDAIVNVTLGAGPGIFPRAGFIPAGGVLRQRRNAGTIDASGLEARLVHRPGDALDLTVAAALTDARVDGGGDAPQLTGLRPAQAPRLSVTAGLVWRRNDGGRLSVDLRHEGPRFDDDLNTRRLGAATTLDAAYEHPLSADVAVRVAVDNLFDADVPVSRTGDDIVGYGPPRRARAELTWRW